jgi:uncharacterized oxidoreductase
MELTNNTVLITGGTSGFGLEFTKRFLELGNTVLITGRDQDKLDKAKEKFPKVHTFKSDVSDISAIIALFETVTKQFPELNILINNAGEMRKINLHDTSIDLLNITREVDINLSGPIRMVQQFLPQLKKQKSAAIMNVTSGIAFGPFPISPVYGATKSGLRSYTQSLRVQLSKTNIKVYELAAPGSSTPLSDKFLDIEGFNPKIFTSAEKVVEQAIKDMKRDRYEILPGLSKLMKIISRLAPKFALSQSAKMGSSYFLHS